MEPKSCEILYFANAELRNASQENEEGHFSLLLRLFILRDGFPEGRFQPNKKYPVIESGQSGCYSCKNGFCNKNFSKI